MQVTGNNQFNEIQKPVRLSDGLRCIDGEYSTERFCLVPKSLYNEDNQDLWLNFARDKIPYNKIILAQEISSQDCICLYEAEKGGNSTHLIVKLLEFAAKQQFSRFAVAYEQNNQLALILISNQKLQFANIFDISADSDIVYYVINLYHLHQLTAVDAPCIVFDNDLSTLLSQYLQCIVANQL